MGRRTSLILTMVTAAVVIGSACSKKVKDKEIEYIELGEYVNLQDSLPRVRYFESNLVSLNDRCAVRKGKLNNKMPPVYVNGQPIGFC